MHMKKSKALQVFIYGIILFAFLVSIPAISDAYYIISGNGSYGHFIGTFTYDAETATAATITVELRNTSPINNGGYLTGFAFNNPSNDITGVSFSSSSASFELLGKAPKKKDADFQNTVKAVPYGYFDIGAALGGNFEGGGKPDEDGIPVGGTANFTFNLTGTNLSILTEKSFFSEYSDSGIAFVTRFRGFLDGQSDKVTGTGVPFQLDDTSVPVPLPSAILLLAPGLIGLGWMRRKS
jgi:hypothetical protein